MKKVLIIGNGKTGKSIIDFYTKKEYEIHLYDDNLKTINVDNEIKIVDLEIIKKTNYNKIFKSPGVKYENEIVEFLIRNGNELVNDIELFSEIFNGNKISITGSNGKTTTTKLIYELLNENGDTLIGGNIGIPILDLDYKKKKKAVLELSSFQLMGIKNYKSEIAVFLNISEAHIDYHGSIENYLKAKQNIFNNQDGEDYSIINYDFKNEIESKIKINSKKIYFSTTEKYLEIGCYVNEENIITINFGDKIEELISVKEIGLKGKHNLENVLSSVIVAKVNDINNKKIIEVLKSFTGVEHRLEFVKEEDGVKYYNDSKATNEIAAINALKSFDANIIHICGGLDRGSEFNLLKDYYSKNKIKKIVTLGESASKIEKICNEIEIECVKVSSMKEAVEKSKEISESGDIVLLSPACASWDMYKTFEERGNEFKKFI